MEGTPQPRDEGPPSTTGPSCWSCPYKEDIPGYKQTQPTQLTSRSKPVFKFFGND